MEEVTQDGGVQSIWDWGGILSGGRGEIVSRASVVLVMVEGGEAQVGKCTLQHYPRLYYQIVNSFLQSQQIFKEINLVKKGFSA